MNYIPLIIKFNNLITPFSKTLIKILKVILFNNV